MIEISITILTGPVHSGKTTYLKTSYEGKKNVYGILTPIINGQRVFLNIATGEIFPMEAFEEEATLAVGKYLFSKESFLKATTILTQALKQKEGTLMLDEVGPLELRGSGFYKIVREMVADKNSLLEKMVVVRESILQDVIHFFQIKNYRIIRL